MGLVEEQLSRGKRNTLWQCKQRGREREREREGGGGESEREREKGDLFVRRRQHRRLSDVHVRQTRSVEDCRSTVDCTRKSA